MAKMIPDIVPESIENNGERVFYDAVRRRPDDFTVFYSYKYYIEVDRDHQIREADFIIVGYHHGQLHEFKHGTYQPLHKNPIEQAQTAMFEILKVYKNKTGGSVWTSHDLEQLEEKLWQLFEVSDRKQERDAANELIHKVLSPSFKLFSTLEDRIAAFRKSAQITHLSRWKRHDDAPNRASVSF